MTESDDPRSTLAWTTSGVVEGERTAGLTIFRGVPYARPPCGPLRFSSPRPASPWTGIRDATRFAPVFVQDGAADSGEDALYANIWTPDTGGSRPVLVYIHGGGWAVGGGSVPTFDGAEPARRGDMVVVTFNYRLGPFGWGLHEQLADPETGFFANWGHQDQAALLRWVRANAAAFGGDPRNITLCGTSAGGAGTWLHALEPEFSDIIQRIIVISAMHPWQPAASLTPDDARTVVELMARRLDTPVPALRRVPAAAVQSAWRELFSGRPEERPVASGREYRGPIVDDMLISGFSYERPTPSVPIMTVYMRTEGSFFTSPGSPSFPPPPPPPADGRQLRAAVRDVLSKGKPEVTDDEVDGCLAAYREAAQGGDFELDPMRLWTEVWGDLVFRHQIMRLAERHARFGVTPQYVMEFAHPAGTPFFGTPHDASSKFLFGTHRLPANAPIFGAGPVERLISDTFIDLVATFARDGTPRSANTPDWPTFAPERARTMMLGGDLVAAVATPTKLRQLRFWDQLDWMPQPVRTDRPL
ncbi:MAG TPA: carboxylesterase family protein [Streptosporangiaceae bacterium]|nr:carboxylesterase family protein [Streptosporangiaceae bacterium]